MTRSKRRALLAGAMSVMASALAIPMIVSGTAHAQAGGRLCGRIYVTTPGSVSADGSTPVHETVIRLYEVQKGDPAQACENATGKAGRSVFDAPFDLRQKDKRFWDSGDPVDMEICEGFKTRADRLDNRDLNFVGGGFPANDQIDICNDMNRSDSVFEMETYWLHDNAETGKWDFVRG